MSKIIGIDLGTTNCAVAVMKASGPDVLENKEGARTTPSVVAISKNNERLVGVAARRQAVINPEKTVYGIKRFIGHRFSDKSVQKDIKLVPFQVKEGKNGGVEIVLDKDYTPEEISAMLLRKLKEDAEAKLGEKITQAVITVPAYFDDAQRKSTKDAGIIAGLDVKRIINEPTAAALAYGFDKKGQKDLRTVVFDFGGGTFDVSVLEISDSTVEVKSTAGDSHLGGRDIDRAILDYIIKAFKAESGFDVSKDPLALQRLDEAVEKAKIELSDILETEINIPFITSNENGPLHLLSKLTRAKLEELSKPFIDKTIKICETVLKDCDCSKSSIQEILLVGGQTRMPAVSKAVESFFGKSANKSINPDEVVALGAAVQGGVLSGDVKDVLLLDVTPLSLGIETLGGVSTKLIEKNATIPTSASQIFSTAADNQTSVNIHIVQGERSMISDNKSIGNFVLDGIDSAARGVPQIEVHFDLDSNGILNVKAVDKKSNKEKSIRIEASSNLSEEEIAKMKEDAELNATKDEQKKALVEARNVAEQGIYEGEAVLKQSNLSDEARKETEDSVNSLKESIKGEDVDAIKNELTQASSVFSKHKSSEDGQASNEDKSEKSSQPEKSEKDSTNEEKKDN